MEKRVSTALICSLLVFALGFGIVNCFGTEKTFGLEQARNISVYVCGHKVDFADQTPEIINDRVMVPLRAVFEHHNVQAEVQWDEQYQMVTATDRTFRIIVFRIGNKTYYVRSNNNTKTKETDVAPIIKNGRTLLPLRALAESLDFEVNWIDGESKVEIKEKAGNTSQDRKLMSPQAWQEYLTRDTSCSTTGGG